MIDALPTLALAGALLLPATVLAQQEPSGDGSDMSHLVPGDSRRGLSVFLDKGCPACHGSPGNRSQHAPDLTQGHEVPLSASELTARLWNHGPAMWASMRERGGSATTITSVEMSDLFAFLIQLSVIEPPGNASLGELIFRYKGCSECHERNANTAKGGPAGPDIEHWGAHSSPLRLARAMWNHADAMGSHLAERGRSWPRLAGSELSDIVAYVRRENSIATPDRFVMGSPSAGRAVFDDKGCSGCHAVDDRSGGGAPASDNVGRGSTTMAGLAARMWSHYPDMVAASGEETARSLFMTEDEMADVVAYLLAVGYLEARGDASHGRELFSSKLCAYCHRGREPVGGNLEGFREHGNLTDFACALWNHGPRMAEWMNRAGIAWPELDRQAIVDLLSYLAEPQ